jgi:hypothetical protein
VVFSQYWTGLHLEHGDSNKTTANETKTKTTSANVTMHGKMQQVKLKFSNARISSGAAKKQNETPQTATRTKIDPLPHFVFAVSVLPVA